MSELDLDINNYGYLELLSLFGLDNNYGEKELKDAKKIVLKMHPDKSKLGPEYFLFFSKAYKTIVQIYEFKNKAEKTSVAPTNLKGYKELIQIVPKKGDDNSNALKKFIETNDMNDPTKFNKWFNDQFDRFKSTSLDPGEKGYEEWYKSNENVSEIDSKTRTKEEVAHEFNKKKQELKSVVKYSGVQEWCASGLGASALCGGDEETVEFNSELFGGNLIYQDLKQAHTECVIPIDESDYDAIPKFRTIDEYQRHRDSDRSALKPLSEKEAERTLSAKSKEVEEASTKRAFYYAKQVEENEKKTNLFWATIKRLSN